ncbi:hypothetical protein Y032_0089g2321 [Ancylostoma ceylanicum]|uniref:Uncharacterized protein n=1 Tax=Ancylostoma ceylanicum TaxID=53326 RepID=A0A016TMQ5_9BILA|nr:hypothetical protein Y032_0089g2321 [Ancylostoma ceylanicum]
MTVQTAPIQLKLGAHRLRWYGHMVRRPSPYSTRQVMGMDVTGKRLEGGPKKRWKDAIRKDMNVVESRTTTLRPCSLAQRTCDCAR